MSYRPYYPNAVYDITHTRNISQGGMLLTTVRAFATGTRLLIQARLTFRGSPRHVKGTAVAVESIEIVQRLLYETRVQFLATDRRFFQIIGDFCKGNDDKHAVTSGARG